MGKFAVLIGFLAVASACGSVQGFNPELFQEHINKALDTLQSSTSYKFDDMITALRVISGLTRCLEDSGTLDLAFRMAVHYVDNFLIVCSPGQHTNEELADMIRGDIVKIVQIPIPFTVGANFKKMHEDCWRIMHQSFYGDIDEQFTEALTNSGIRSDNVLAEVCREEPTEMPAATAEPRTSPPIRKIPAFIKRRSPSYGPSSVPYLDTSYPRRIDYLPILTEMFRGLRPFTPAFGPSVIPRQRRPYLQPMTRAGSRFRAGTTLRAGTTSGEGTTFWAGTTPGEGTTFWAGTTPGEGTTSTRANPGQPRRGSPQ